MVYRAEWPEEEAGWPCLDIVELGSMTAARTATLEWVRDRPEGRTEMAGTRTLAKIVGVAAAILLFYEANPWIEPPEGIVRDAVSVSFWILFIGLLVLLYRARMPSSGGPEVESAQVREPAFARFLFDSTQASLFWLPIRLFLGFAWLEAGWHKLTGGGWIDGGSALKGFWTAAVAVPEKGRVPISYEWYRDFINTLLAGGHETWFAWVITFGELAIGVGLLVGMLTGVAAFFGALMNMSFLLAGSASSNPVLFTLAIGLILAWKVAGYYGIDRYLLPLLGTPWRPGSINGAGTHRLGAPAG
jgi:thiosulfate dehydrogenase (quinone) large subunit